MIFSRKTAFNQWGPFINSTSTLVQTDALPNILGIAIWYILFDMGLTSVEVLFVDRVSTRSSYPQILSPQNE